MPRRLGSASAIVLCVVAVGGSGVGEPLLRRVLDAVAPARERMPELRSWSSPVPASTRRACPAAPGVEVRGYVPDLYLHLAAADVAVVQGGLTTTMELAAARVPFLYVPLQHHFEQNVHVPHRLQQLRRRAVRALRRGRRPGPGWRRRSSPGRQRGHLVAGRDRRRGAGRAMLEELL